VVKRRGAGDPLHELERQRLVDIVPISEIVESGVFVVTYENGGSGASNI